MKTAGQFVKKIDDDNAIFCVNIDHNPEEYSSLLKYYNRLVTNYSDVIPLHAQGKNIVLTLEGCGECFKHGRTYKIIYSVDIDDYFKFKADKIT